MTWEKHPSPLMSSHGGVAQFAAIRRNSRVISEIKTRSNEITPDEMSSQVHHTTHRTHPKHMGTGGTHHSKAHYTHPVRQHHTKCRCQEGFRNKNPVS